MGDQPSLVRQLIILPKDEMWEAVHGDHADYQKIAGWPVEQGRWTTTYSVIVQNVETGRFYEGWYARGSTEMQEGSEDICRHLTEVRLEPETVLVWKPVLRPEKKDASTK